MAARGLVPSGERAVPGERSPALEWEVGLRAEAEWGPPARAGVPGGLVYPPALEKSPSTGSVTWLGLGLGLGLGPGLG